MHRITKILAGLTLAAGTFGATAAFAMGDGYHYRSTTTYYYTSPDSTYDDTLSDTTHLYVSPGTTYSYTSPGTTYYYGSPGTTYYYAPPAVTYEYVPRGTYGYYDNPYNPYWSYRGSLGQGSGHDMRIGR